jgi:hypothetical protein
MRPDISQPILGVVSHSPDEGEELGMQLRSGGGDNFQIGEESRARGGESIP